jgi:hypothetical protein
MALNLYVIIVSDHNLAELRACLYLKPDIILMVSSKRMEQAANRLSKVLKNQLSNKTIEIVGATQEVNFGGDSLNESLIWLDTVFLPKLTHFSPSSAQLNMTGGTKSLSLLLTRIYPWQEIHYQPFGYTVPLERFCIKDNGLLHLLESIDLSNVDIAPKDNALLYMDYVRPHTANTIRQQSDSLALALLRLEAQQVSNNNQGLAAFIKLFEKAWSEPTNGKFVTVAIPQNLNLDLALLDRLNQLYYGSHQMPLSLTPNGLNLPSFNNHHYKEWRKWISGDWYEQLIEHWLLEYGIDKKYILSNVQLSSNTDRQGQETDTLLQYKNRLYIIEIKADIPPNKSLGDMENQLTSLSMQLGKVNNVLIVSPAIRKRYSNEQWLNFELRCKNKNVKLYVVNSKKSFITLFFDSSSL